MTLPYADDFRKSVAGDSGDLFVGVNAISQLLNPDNDGLRTDAAINRLAALAGDEGVATAQDLCKFLSKQGFSTTTQSNFHEYCNSDVAWVIENRQGIPISIGMVIHEISRQLALPCAGINFPGVFIVQVEESFIDPVTFGCVSYETLTLEAKRQGISTPSEPQLASNQDIIQRMFNNLRAVAQVKRDWVRDLEFLDYLQVINPDLWYFHAEKARLWALLGDLPSAHLEFQRAQKKASGEAAEVQSLILKGLQQTSPDARDRNLEN